MLFLWADHKCLYWYMINIKIQSMEYGTSESSLTRTGFSYWGRSDTSGLRSRPSVSIGWLWISELMPVNSRQKRLKTSSETRLLRIHWLFHHSSFLLPSNIISRRDLHFKNFLCVHAFISMARGVISNRSNDYLAIQFQEKIKEPACLQ